jgi:hypothetical protein
LAINFAAVAAQNGDGEPSGNSPRLFHLRMEMMAGQGLRDK